ncbi:hypothetical protein OG426_18385 [Streptomyces canus]|uniref:hypothetical protein n=1 Tax=Streptomyces canus TaxID=58343 RepID=UPI00225A4C28|nr:hypothetical protein [Streptomyces canus]MCX4860488.1 hypothetical protein [Streptomyces canus]WSW34314.1 hypothetical protein OG426_18385 [Streptomyces canus]
MTHRAGHKEPLEREALSRRGEFLEFLGLTAAAGVFALFVVRPDVSAELVHYLATRTAGFAP